MKLCGSSIARASRGSFCGAILVIGQSTTKPPRTPRAPPQKRLVDDGAFAFACDPQLPTSAAPVIWRPELVPHSVILVPAPASFPNARRLASADLTGALTAHRDRDGRHLVLPGIEGPHRLWLRDGGVGMRMAAIVPLDDSAVLRVAGVLRLQRHLAGKRAGPVPRGWELTARLRRRLALMVRALDGHQVRASYREISMVLYGPAAVARYPWKTSSIRGQTIRLVKDAVVMMEGGYRNLLRGGRPPDRSRSPLAL